MVSQETIKQSILSSIQRVEWIGLQSPITVDELLFKPVPEIIEILIIYQREKSLGPDREALLFTAPEAVARPFLLLNWDIDAQHTEQAWEGYLW